MADPEGHEHGWVRARLDAHAFGLLDDAEERRFLDHVASCDACAGIVKAYAGLGIHGPRNMHVPSRILARWDRAQRLLQGMSRRLVREHLERCASCRQDLELLGFSPVLERDPQLEGEADPAAAWLVTDPPPVVRIEVERRRRGPGAWLLAGAVGGGAAAAAVSILTFAPPPRAIDPPPPAPPAAAPAFDLHVLPAPIALIDAPRSSSAVVPSIRLERETRALAIVLPELFLPDTTTLDVALVGPAGQVIDTTSVRAGAVAGQRSLLLTSPAPFPAGDYALRVRPRTEGDAEPDHRFVFRLLAP